MRVVAGRDDDQVRTESCDGWNNDLTIDLLEGFIARVVGHRHVERQAIPCSFAHLPQCAGPRKEWPGMRGTVQYPPVIIEDILRAVAVMRIPVDDRHTLQSEHIKR